MANEITSVCAPGLGYLAGRIQPAGWTVPDGDWAICLGADSDAFVVDTWPAFRRGLNGTYPTGFAGGETIQFTADHETNQTITFQATDQTLAQVVDRINATAVSAVASDDDGELKIETESRGMLSHLAITGGTGTAQLGHLVTSAVGHGGLMVGDYFGFTQAIDLTTTTLLAFKCKFRQPSNTDIKFKLSLVVNGEERMSVIPAAGTTVDFSTRYVNVADIAGSVPVAFYVEAIAA